jgi:hypothetical protein
LSIRRRPPRRRDHGGAGSPVDAAAARGSPGGMPFVSEPPPNPFMTMTNFGMAIVDSGSCRAVHISDGKSRRTASANNAIMSAPAGRRRELLPLRAAGQDGLVGTRDVPSERPPRRQNGPRPTARHFAPANDTRTSPPKQAVPAGMVRGRGSGSRHPSASRDASAGRRR